MLPVGYVGLVVCDTRRAREWHEALRRRGFDVVLAETRANEDKGGWVVGVAEADAVPARAFVGEVTTGRASLAPPWFRQPQLLLMLLIVAGVVAWALLRAS